MTANNTTAQRGLALALALLALYFIAGMGAFSHEARAQAQPDSGATEYTFPALGDKDFQLFLDLRAAKTDADKRALLTEKNVSPEHATAVTIKIIANLMPPDSDAAREAAREMGPSIVFSDSEKRLLEKYEAQLRKALED